MIEIAGLVVAGISAMGTLVQAYYNAKSAKKNVSRTKIKQAKERASEPLKIGQKKVAEIIDVNLLQALQQEIESQNNRLIHVFSSKGVSEKEKEREVEAARLKICHFLNQVMNFNEGELPTKRLQNLWASNRCNQEQDN